MAERTCSLDGCDRPYSARGRCQQHYDTYRHYGRDALLTREDRFWAKVDRSAELGCWTWLGAKGPSGYGHFSVDGRVIGAHRAAFLLAYGYLPAVVRHACDNPPCVNPKHLLPGNFAMNSADMARRGRSARGERSGAARLTAGQVTEIRRLVASGQQQKVVAAAFGVSKQTVNVIVLRKVWRHI